MKRIKVSRLSKKTEFCWLENSRKFSGKEKTSRRESKQHRVNLSKPKKGKLPNKNRSLGRS